MLLVPRVRGGADPKWLEKKVRRTKHASAEHRGRAREVFLYVFALRFCICCFSPSDAQGAGLASTMASCFLLFVCVVGGARVHDDCAYEWHARGGAPYACFRDSSYKTHPGRHQTATPTHDVEMKCF